MFTFDRTDAVDGIQDTFSERTDLVNLARRKTPAQLFSDSRPGNAVIIGSPARLGRRARVIIEYITRYRDALASMPAFWFAVGGSETASSERMRRTTGWLPTHSFGVVRPGWRVRWFDDPSSERAPRIHEIAHAIGDEIPARELESP